MSISEQVKELREIATNWNPNVPINPVSVVLNKAADTIEALTAKLQAANMELIEKIDREIDGVIVKDTYSKGKNAGLRKAKILVKEQLRQEQELKEYETD
ncbi:hypothetical protein [uncultured Bacteroides sp.]|uniref:hypothetical protein n=1 Tax=uncultured Bacteroides sp. TaxID=162156 RepID=UPI002613079E|nr:hypothetical protein [uncultured Bacteroides sp.]